MDKRVELGIFALDSSTSIKYNGSFLTETAMVVAEHLENSLLFGRPVNQALYVARIIGLSNPAVQKKLKEFRVKEGEKYGEYADMTINDFY